MSSDTPDAKTVLAIAELVEKSRTGRLIGITGTDAMSLAYDLVANDVTTGDDRALFLTNADAATSALQNVHDMWAHLQFDESEAEEADTHAQVLKVTQAAINTMRKVIL